MSTVEDRVRDALRADAETVRPGTIPGVPSRPTRPAPGRTSFARARILVPLAAAAAVIAIVTSLSLTAPYLLSGGRPGSGPQGSPPTGQLPTAGGSQPPARLLPAPQPALAADASRGVPSLPLAPGVPRFYATLEPGTNPTAIPDTLVVRNTARGQVTGEMKSPAGSVFAGLAATAGDRTFITAVDPGTSCGPVQLYWFQLSQLGVPGPIQALHIALPGSVPQGEGDLAVTPDGGTIAYDAQGCNASEPGEVGVINLATRQTRAWAYASLSPAAFITSDIHDVSLSASGQLLGFSTFDGTSVLQTDAPAGPLYSRSRTVSRTMTWAAIDPDGRSLYGCAVAMNPGSEFPRYSTAAPSFPPASSDYGAAVGNHYKPSDLGTLTYSQLSLTGGGDHVILSRTNVKGPQCDASLDPAGNYLLVQYPAIANGADEWSYPAILDLATHLLLSITSPAFYGPLDIAW